MEDNKFADKKWFEESGQDLMHEAMAFFGGGASMSAQASAPSTCGPIYAMEKSPQDIPKEELMILCMKLNKRMQSLRAKCKTWQRKRAVFWVSEDNSWISSHQASR